MQIIHVTIPISIHQFHCLVIHATCLLNEHTYAFIWSALTCDLSLFGNFFVCTYLIFQTWCKAQDQHFDGLVKFQGFPTVPLPLQPEKQDYTQKFHFLVNKQNKQI